MKKRIGIVTGCLVATAIMGAGSIHAQNRQNELSVNIPSAGIALVLDQYQNEHNDEKAELSALIKNTVVASNNNTETTAPMETTSAEAQQETTQQETTTEAPKETSIYDTIAMSQVNDYVNVRSMPSTDGEIVGKIYNNCAATIIENDGEWYKIQSGNVTGYIKSEYFVTGDAAKQIAIQCGYVNATVTTQTLNVRENQGTDSKILTQLPEGGVFDVIQYGDGWVYLSVDGDIKGWVSMEFVNIDVKFNTAITLEEEQAKLAEEKRLADEAAKAEQLAKAAKEAEKTKNKKTEQKKQQQQQSKQEEVDLGEATDTSSSSALRNAVVAYALQFQGNPYVYGGSSLTNGTDCSGFTMSVYAKFGYGLPHSSGSQSGSGTKVSLNSLLPGDLLFYTNGGSSIGHVALYIGNGQVIHASTPSSGIIVSSYNYRTPVSAVRVIN